GSDLLPVVVPSAVARFLSTLPARGATQCERLPHLVDGISIHAPREGSDVDHSRVTKVLVSISIHAPREGSDHGQSFDLVRVHGFLSTLPARGATLCTLHNQCFT